MDKIIGLLFDLNQLLHSFVWGPVMLILLVGTGVYLSALTHFLQLVRFHTVIKETLLKIFHKPASDNPGDITPFQALSTALAATIGTGNIAGVATAITIGGPGAIFWMWVSAFFGMMTKYAEIVLAIQYRSKNNLGNFVGGPMYYIEKGLCKKWLAAVFSVFGAAAAFGIGNMVQSNSVAAAVKTTFNISPLLTGLFLAGAASLVILGGINRIASVTDKLVPLMAGFYITAVFIILLINYKEVIPAFQLIFKHAFAPLSAAGGLTGLFIEKALPIGIARGVFSNEAGLGSASIAHAAAKTDHPVRQGLWGIFEVFTDTIIMSTLTALAVLTTGVWLRGEQVTGAALTAAAFNKSLPVVGGYIVTIGILLFAFSTILGWAYYGEKCAEHLLGSRINIYYRIIWIPLIIVGATANLELVWSIADTMNGLMAVPNLIGVIGLSGVVFRLTKDFFR